MAGRGSLSSTVGLICAKVFARHSGGRLAQESNVSADFL